MHGSKPNNRFGMRYQVAMETDGTKQDAGYRIPVVFFFFILNLWIT